MRLKVYEAKLAEEDVVRVRAIAYDGAIELWAVDEKGDVACRGRIARLCPEGLGLDKALNPALGFPRDVTGRIQLIDYP